MCTLYFIKIAQVQLMQTTREWKKLCRTRTQVKNEKGDDHIKSKCTVMNYERNIANLIKMAQLQTIQTI